MVWIWPSKAAEPSQCWAVKMVQSDGTTKYTLINVPEKTKLEKLAHWQSQRFFLELAFKTAKGHVGAADYQMRKWRGWHHHMALVGLAMLFILEEKLDHATSCPQLFAADITEMLDFYFCNPTNAEDVIDRILARHSRRRAATASKRRVAAERPKKVCEKPPTPPAAAITLRGGTKKIVTK